MTLIATLLFLGALATSIGVITLTLRGALPRIREVVAMELTPVQNARQIRFGAVRYCTAAEIIAFPVAATRKADSLLLAA